MDQTLAQRAAYLYSMGYLPVPVKSGDKHPPAEGFTGVKNPDPTLDDWHAYVEAHLDYGNLAIRLPIDVVGVDLDYYKPEGAETHRKIKDWLIPTAVISARMAADTDTDHVYDGHSGIYLYRSRLDSGGLPGVDLIRNGHRYAMAPGSLHPSGRFYRTIDYRTGQLDLPHVNELPDLPRGLEQMLHQSAVPKIAPGKHAMESTTLIRGAEPCNYNLQMLKRFERIDLHGPSGGELPTSRHDEMGKVIWSVIQGIGNGHRGAHTVLARMVDQARSQNEARVGEVLRLIGNRFPVERTGLGEACPNCDDDAYYTFGLVAGTQPPASARPTSDREEVEEAGAVLFTQRDWLTWCYETGTTIGHGPWGLVGAVLAYCSSQISPEVTVDVGLGPMSLNTYVMLVGGPSAGKSLALATVANANRWEVEHFGLGTGEGIPAHFGHPVEEKDEDTGKKVRRIERHRTRGLLSEDEWGRQTDVGGRGGQTVMSVLRTAWMGHALGQANRDPKTAIPIAKHSYRLTVIAGAQPSVAMDVLGGRAADLGTTQRFLVFEATKTAMSKGTINPFPHRIPSRLMVDYSGRVRMGLDEDAQAAWMAMADLEVHEGDYIGEHRATRVLKTAALVALIEGRTLATIEDWVLADALVKHSDNTVRRVTSRAVEQARDAKIYALVQEEEALASARTVSDAKRVAALVAKAGEDGLTRAKISTSLWKSAIRKERAGPAIDHAVAQGLVVAIESSQADGSTGHRYFLPPSR